MDREKSKGPSTRDQGSNDEFFEHIEIVVDRGQSPLRIDRFLLDRLMDISRNRIQIGIRSGAILVNGEGVKPNYKVRPNDLITIVFPRMTQEGRALVAENIPLDIVYEDDDLLVVNKSAGMVVHPGVGNWTGTLVNALAYHLRGNNQQPVLEGNSSDRPGLVHRIDKHTSGLLVVAKNEFALTHLAKQFFEHTVQRRYMALVWGQPEEKEGTIDAYIGRDPKDRIRQTVFPEGDSGKHAITHFKVVEPMYYVSVIHCWLETGRTHQIRVHLRHLGHPLFGDDRYGGDRIVKGTVYQKYKQFIHNCFKWMPHQALHAMSLGFIHPTSGKSMSFEVQPPENFCKLLEKWRNYLATRKS